MRVAISAEAYGHDTTSKSGNDADVTQNGQTFAFNNMSQIHFKSDTLFCNNILLHSAKYYLLDFTVPFLSITPLRLWGSVGYKHCCGIFTTLHKRKAHYSRVRSTLVPSVACQTTEGEYLLLTTLLLTDTL